MNPAMRDCERAPRADQAYSNDCGKAKVLARYDAPRRNPAAKKKVRRNASSTFVTANVVMLADITARY
jgi:hypothetical protein